MRRFQLIEIHEQPWCPSFLRDGITDYLEVSIKVTGIYQQARDWILPAIQKTKSTRILDLCSGGGGPWPALFPALRKEVRGLELTLTDRNPNIEGVRHFSDATGVSYSARPVDALNVPADLKGFRTLFTAFHHFPPPLAKRILADAVRNREGIALFEGAYRSGAALFLMLLVPLAVMILTLFIRPVRWTSLLFTYLIPILPLMMLWDGWVSCLRTYTVDEMRSMAAEVSSEYEWQAGEIKIRGSAIPVSYLVGIPK